MKSIEYYIKGLFRNIERTPEISDQIEELSCHMRERMQDLCSSGMSEEDALEKTIQGLGDIDELIDTISGKKIRLPVNKIKIIESSAGTLYGALYLSCVTISFWNLGVGKPALFLTIPAFAAGYVVPFVFSLVRYCMFPKKTALCPVPSVKPIYTGLIGWFVISLICVIANLLMYISFPTSNFWAWMPVAGVFTWPVMESVSYFAARHESKKERSNAF